MKVDIGGFEGSPGVSVFHIEGLVEPDDIGNAAQELHDAYQGISTYLINGLTVVVNQEVLVINPEDGKLQRVIIISPPPVVTGGDTSTSMPRMTMAVVKHSTDQVIDGHRLNGRTFVGPIGGAAMAATGHLSTTAQTAFGAMFDGLQDIAGGGRLMVYHRPKTKDESGNQIPPQGGFAAHVQNSACLPKPGSLRSRRD